MAAAAQLMKDKAEVAILHGMSGLRPSIMTENQHIPVPGFPAEEIYGLSFSLIAEIFADDCLNRHHTRYGSEGIPRILRIRLTTSTAFPLR